MPTALVKIIVYPDVKLATYHRVVRKFEFPGKKKFRGKVADEVDEIKGEVLALLDKPTAGGVPM